MIDKDCLQVCIGPNKKVRKYHSTSSVMFVTSVFDPMGIFAPLTMRMRMLLKSIWIRFDQYLG